MVLSAEENELIQKIRSTEHTTKACDSVTDAILDYRERHEQQKTLSPSLRPESSSIAV